MDTMGQADIKIRNDDPELRQTLHAYKANNGYKNAADAIRSLLKKTDIGKMKLGRNDVEITE